MNDTVHGNLKSKQLGTVLFFIDNFGIRVGNEKDQDEAETVGATTLESGHIELNAPDGIKLHFLGKDSILFSKTLVVPEPIFRNLEMFKQGKTKKDQLFNLVDATDINEYLKQFDKTFSAKVFRTRLATSIMLDELSKLKVPKKITKKDLDHLFKKANVKVAEVLNHTRNVPAGASKAIDKLQDKIKTNIGKMKTAKTEKAKNKLKEANKKLRKDIKTKQETKGVAVTTSLTNYIDPRVVAQWMAKYEIPPAYVYSTALLKKFKWAIDSTKSDWNYEKEPLFGVSDDFVGEDQEPPVENPVVEPPVEDPVVEPPVDVEDDIPKKKASRPRRSRSKRTPVAMAADVAYTDKKERNPTREEIRIETLFTKPSWISDEKYNEYTFELADYCDYGKEPSIEAIEAMWHLIKRGNTTKSRELMGLYFNLRHIFSK
jgi:DNA topoisomerase IB